MYIVHKLIVEDTGEIVGIQEFFAQENEVGPVVGVDIIDTELISALKTDIPSVSNIKYWDGENIQDRPIINTEPNKLTMIADGVDSVTISDLPIPCTVTINDTEYEVDDGEFEFTTDVADTYTITVASFPYITKSWEVTAS